MQTNVFVRIWTIFAQIWTIFAKLIIGCMIRYPKIDNLRYSGSSVHMFSICCSYIAQLYAYDYSCKYDLFSDTLLCSIESNLLFKLTPIYTAYNLIAI